MKRKDESLSTLKKVYLLLSFLACFFLFSSPLMAKYAAIVIDAKTGKILHQENPHKQTYPASLTKMMTLYETFLALDKKQLKMNDALTVSAHAERQSPSKLGLKKGQKILVKDAIKGLVTKSANDAAVVLAEALANTEPNFAAQMTQRARQLGMTHTSFRNASGLPNPYQVTTARDMAILSRALIHHFPHYYHYFSTKLFKYKGNAFTNHNHLVGKVIGYKNNHPIIVDGIKTGFIVASGFNLAASARFGEQRIIGIVMGGENRNWRDRRMEILLTKSFDKNSPINPAIFTVTKKMGKNKINTLRKNHQKTLKLKIKEKTYPKVIRMGSPQSNNWLVQVGAFKHAKDAHNMIAHAQKKAGQLLQAAKTIARPSSNRKNPLFRAQFTYLTLANAKKSCGLLQKKGINCIISQH